MSQLTVMKGLPMTYNRDMQEDKEPLFDSVDTVILSLSGMIEMLKTMKINEAKMNDSALKNYSTAKCGYCHICRSYLGFLSNSHTTWLYTINMGYILKNNSFYYFWVMKSHGWNNILYNVIKLSKETISWIYRKNLSLF